MTNLLHQRLSDAAMAGDIDELYVVLEQDSCILEAIDQSPFTNTTLHIAVTAGQACFVEEITNLKPSFVRKINQNGYSPMHLAATNGQVEMVRQFLKVDSCLAKLKGREKRTPVHCAVIAGSIEVLDELIFSCPNSLRKLTVRKETALHLAVKHGQLEAIKALLRWIEELDMESILSCTDQDGNTLLHLATTLRQHQIVKMLCNDNKFRRSAKVNARNNSGLTALELDESLRHPDEPHEVQNISNILQNAGSVQACIVKINKPPPSPTNQPRLAIQRRQRILHYLNFRVHEDTSLDVRNTLLVILVLIATATFEVGINLPGGNWEEDNGKHIAGEPIWNRKDPIGYYIFTAVKFAGFVMSSVLIFRLVEGYPNSGPVQVAQSLLVFTSVWSSPLLPYTNEVNFILLIVAIPVGAVGFHWINRKPKQYFS